MRSVAWLGDTPVTAIHIACRCYTMYILKRMTLILIRASRLRIRGSELSVKVYAEALPVLRAGNGIDDIKPGD